MEADLQNQSSPADRDDTLNGNESQIEIKLLIYNEQIRAQITNKIKPIISHSRSSSAKNLMFHSVVYNIVRILVIQLNGTPATPLLISFISYDENIRHRLPIRQHSSNHHSNIISNRLLATLTPYRSVHAPISVSLDDRLCPLPQDSRLDTTAAPQPPTA